MGKVLRKIQLLRHARQILAREGDSTKRKSAYLHLKERLEFERNDAAPSFNAPLFVVCVAQALQHFPTFYTHAVIRRRKVGGWRTPSEEWWDGRESEWAQCSRVSCKMTRDGHAGACTPLAVGDSIQVLYFILDDHVPKVAQGTVVRLRGVHQVLVRYADGEKEKLDLRVAQWKYCAPQ